MAQLVKTLSTMHDWDPMWWKESIFDWIQGSVHELETTHDTAEVTSNL